MEFDAERLRTMLATLGCRNCGSTGATATIEHDGPHFARIECQTCRIWIDWLRWPVDRPSERKRRRPRITQLGEDRCELCLRQKFELPEPETLQEHHVAPHGDSGEDIPDNTRVYCSSCHALVEWARTYFGHYHQDLAPWEP